MFNFNFIGVFVYCSSQDNRFSSRRLILSLESIHYGKQHHILPMERLANIVINYFQSSNVWLLSLTILHIIRLRNIMVFVDLS